VDKSKPPFLSDFTFDGKFWKRKILEEIILKAIQKNNQSR